MKQDTIPQAEALSIDDVGRIAGIGRTTIYKLINSGALPARKLGRRTLVMRGDLATCLESLPKAAEAGRSVGGAAQSSESKAVAQGRDTPRARLSRSLKRRAATRP